jgi:hypothetical protein
MLDMAALSLDSENRVPRKACGTLPSSVKCVSALLRRQPGNEYSFDGGPRKFTRYDYGSGFGSPDSHDYDGDGFGTKPERRSPHDVYDFA